MLKAWPWSKFGSSLWGQVWGVCACRAQMNAWSAWPWPASLLVVLKGCLADNVSEHEEKPALMRRQHAEVLRSLGPWLHNNGIFIINFPDSTLATVLVSPPGPVAPCASGAHLADAIADGHHQACTG